MCARYLGQRRQFGAPLAAFQLVQEKLQRMLATCQAMCVWAQGAGQWGRGHWSIPGRSLLRLRRLPPQRPPVTLVPTL